MDLQLISLESIRTAASGLLHFLAEKQVNVVSNLALLAGSSYQIPSSLAHIEVFAKPSSTYDGNFYGVSYILPYLQGVPLEVRFHLVVSLTDIIVKSHCIIADYLPFAKDPMGNIAQNKSIFTCTIAGVSSELRRLQELR